jgi:hypothetical protein
MIEEAAGLDGPAETYRFGGTLPESWYAADIAGPRRLARGAGAIVHHPLPVEWSEPAPALGRFYRAALKGAALSPQVVLDGGPKPGLLLVPVLFRDAWLLVAVNESARDHQVVARRPGSSARVTFDVGAGLARMAFVDPRKWVILDLSAQG